MLAAIARRSDGAVVLPGLDQDLDDESFALIEGGKIGDVEIDGSPGHPQFGLKRLLDRIGIARADVKRIEASGNPTRERFLSHAFRPAATTERWRTDKDAPLEVQSIEALKRVTIIEAADPRAEALAIALALRETLESRASARRWSRPTARWRAGSPPSSRAGKSRSKIRRAFRSATPKPACSPACWPQRRPSGWRRCP